MADRRSLESIIASLKSRAWNGRAYRVMLNEYPPDRENTQGARWNPPDLAAIYTCLDASVCIAEVDYNLTHQPRPLKPSLRKTLYQINVSLSAAVDIEPILSDLKVIGLDTPQLFADDMRASQEIGRLVTWFGYDGLLVPSARSTGKILVIYPGRANEYYKFDVLNQRLL